MNVTVERVTPDVAKSWLTNNVSNRPLSTQHVNRLSDEMSHGRWKDNGDPIRFNGTGLIDGQHRLHAVIQSGRSLQAVVVRELGDVFDTIDCGKKRNLADVFAVRGESQYKLLASAVAALDRYYSGKLERGGSTRKSPQVYQDLLDKHPGLRHSVKYFGASSRRRECLASPGTMAALHYLFSLKDSEMADTYMHGLVSGAGLDVGHPVLLLRERLIRNKTSKGTISDGYICALAIKAWNAMRDGKKMRYLRFREEGGKPEPFPEIK